MMTPDDTSSTARNCCMGARAKVCSKCRYGFCPVCDPGIALAPFTCRKCRKGATSDCCTCGDTLWRCWSCDRRQCPRCWRVLGVTPYQCRFCDKEDSGLAGKQAPHDIGAVLEIARQENERLLAALKTCVTAMTKGMASAPTSEVNLRGAWRIAQAAIEGAEGQPTDTGSDGESGASTKQASPPSEPMVVDLLVEFQDKLAQVIADLHG